MIGSIKKRTLFYQIAFTGYLLNNTIAPLKVLVVISMDSSIYVDAGLVNAISKKSLLQNLR